MGKLTGRTFIITGATRGMGAGIARLFAEHGAHLILSGRNRDRGSYLQQELTEKGYRAVFMEGDITLPDCNRELVDAALARFGTLNGIVTNAGMLGLGPVTDLDEEIWHQTMRTNLDSVFYLLKYAVPHLVKTKKGVAVINASIAAYKSFPNHPAYCASKAGLVALARQVATDYGPHLRINSICPGPVDTPLIHESAAAFPDPEKAVSNAAESTLLKRLGTPADIANLALFLACDDSSWITGSTFNADGGVMASQ